jgi:hypothetical protein
MEEGERERIYDQEIRMVKNRESRLRQRALVEELMEADDDADSRSDWHSNATMSILTDTEARLSNREAENSDDNLNSRGRVDVVCISNQLSTHNHVQEEFSPDEPDYMTNHLVKRSGRKGSNYTYLALVLIAIAAVTIGITVPLLKKDNSPEAMVPVEDQDDVDSQRLAEAISKLAIASSLDDLDSQGSPQHSALMWLVTEDKLSAIDGNNSEEQDRNLLTRYVLAVFYYSLGGQSWVTSEGWIEPEVEACDWQFINCTLNEMEHVTAIHVESRNGLQGVLPSELQHLPRLGEYHEPLLNRWSLCPRALTTCFYINRHAHSQRQLDHWPKWKGRNPDRYVQCHTEVN